MSPRSLIVRRSLAGALACGALAVVVFACSPAPKEPDPAQDLACSTDADCTLTCESRGGCCPSPCACSSAMSKTAVSSIEAYNRDHCTEDDRKNCPVVGACAPVDDPFEARCEAGSCVARRTKEPKLLPQQVSVSGLDTTCNQDADCVTVDDFPCVKSGCYCSKTVIAKSAKPEFDARAGKIQCGSVDDRACGECRRNLPFCDTSGGASPGHCATKPE
ncbi:MAG: hypothetical protein U0271_22765 [Polyangiaceae bacterium]